MQINEEIAAVMQETLTKVMKHFEERHLMCTREERRHIYEVNFQDIKFYLKIILNSEISYLRKILF